MNFRVPKKEYTPPEMKVEKIELSAPLLSGSNDNPWWKDEQPSPEDWWATNERMNQEPWRSDA